MAVAFTSPINHPEYRVYSRPTFSAEWAAVPTLGRMADGIPGVAWLSTGAIVLPFSRALFPNIGTARIVVPYGGINGRSMVPGDVYSLIGKQIRIDASDGGDFKTVWWGKAVGQTDVKFPAGASPESGSLDAPHARREILCRELSFDWMYAPVSERYFVPLPDSAGDIRRVTGMAPYNISPDGGRSPNCSSIAVTESGVDIPEGQTGRSHCPAGVDGAQYWLDRYVAQNALLEAALAGLQPIRLDDTHEQLGARSSLALNDGATVYDILKAILRKDRGTGAVFLDWTDTLLEAGSICYLRIMPQSLEDTTTPNGESSTGQIIIGAATAGTTQAITLTGDTRIDPASFSLETNEEMRADRVVTQGEKIQIAVTIGYTRGGICSLAQVDEGRAGWTPAAQTAFDALTDDDEAEDSKYAAVYLRHTLDPQWNLNLRYTDGDGNAAAARCEYYCDDEGLIKVRPEPSWGSVDGVRVLPYLPCSQSVALRYEEAGGAVVPGSASDASSSLHPVVFHYHDGDTVIPWSDSGLAFSYSVRILPNGFQLVPREPEGTSRAAGAADDFSNILATVGMELPHRVRLATTNARSDAPGHGFRTQVVNIPEAHLWIGHTGATLTPEYSIGASYVIYRDDRDMLRYAHAQACRLYLIDRSRMSYTVRNACGLLQTFQAGETTHNYPQLGKIISSLDYAGNISAVEMLVTEIICTENGTTFRTDWA